MIAFVRRNKLVFLVNIVCFMLIGLSAASMAITGGSAMDERWLYEQYLSETSRFGFTILLTSFFAFIFNIVALTLSFKKQASN